MLIKILLNFEIFYSKHSEHALSISLTWFIVSSVIKAASTIDKRGHWCDVMSDDIAGS